MTSRSFSGSLGRSVSGSAPDPSAMFEPEVIAELRRQFDAADKDHSGELDAAEACDIFSRSCDPGASEAEIKKLSDNLRNQLDSDRSGTISFNEYCFRFGRRYQQEIRRQRSGASRTSSAAAGESEAAAELRREREALEREREALRREREELHRPSSTQGAGDATTGTSSSPSGNLQPGTLVVLQGLRGAPELNGRSGTVLRYDNASSRFVVQLDGDGVQKSLR